MVDFVGFAPSPKVPPGSRLLTNQRSFHLSTNHKDAAAALLNKVAAARWLGAANAWQLDVGSKISFSTGPLSSLIATVTQNNLPKSFALITDEFGELLITVAKSGGGSRLDLVFSRWCLAPDEQAFNELSAQLIQRAATELEVINVD